MKKRKEIFLKLLAVAALNTAEKQADTKCILFGYEPKKPESLKNRLK